jgi:hypothetical protein
MLSRFSYVPIIRAIHKPCDLKLWQVIDHIGAGGRFDYCFNVTMLTQLGDVEVRTIRWCMNLKSSRPRDWSTALLLHNLRFDGIDWEGFVDDHRGHRCSGWHRHIWDSAIESCQQKKECLDGFGTHQTKGQFIRDVCSVLQIGLVEGGEYENAEPGMLFN